MGYECDVAIVIKKSNKKKLLNLIHDLDDEWYENKDKNRDPNEYDYPTDYAINVYKKAEQKEINKYLILQWHGVKWYSIDRGYKFFRNLGREQTIKCDYICIGENPGDVDEHYGLDSGIIEVCMEPHIVVYE